MRKNITLAFALPIAVVLGLSGCGQSESQASGSEPSEVASSQVEAAGLSLDDAWVKAADDGMTAVFGELHNSTDHDINLVEAKYSDAEMVQLHETTEDGSGGMSMQEKKGGFDIPAGKSVSLKPGGDHIMIMGLKKAIKPGEQITVELVTADDQTTEVTAVAKEYSGAQEDYAPGEADSGHDGDGDEKSGDDGESSDHADSDHGGSESDHGDHGDH
ncbi:copper chaperone PCu(A)C [Brevibacterium oceani]|uniref:copper chaperone PCu(A)C n=1 Tax=Brevibacterium oceani TaxID=358099 RepID=UPI0015E75EE7|nr:copper chaperone PCu(A)C [Brevibacterium oceani]